MTQMIPPLLQNRLPWIALLIAVLIGVSAQYAWLVADYGPPESDEWHHLTKSEALLHGWYQGGLQGFFDACDKARTTYPPLAHVLALPWYVAAGGFSLHTAELSLIPSLALLMLATGAIAHEAVRQHAAHRPADQRPADLFPALLPALAALTVAGMPIVVCLSHKFLLDLTLAACCTACLYALIRSDRLLNPGWTWIAGVMAGLAILAKFTAGVYLLGPFALPALLRLSECLRRRPLLTLSLLGAAGWLARAWWLRAGFPDLDDRPVAEAWFDRVMPPVSMFLEIWLPLSLLALAAALLTKYLALRAVSAPAAPTSNADLSPGWRGLTGLLSLAAATLIGCALGGLWYSDHLYGTVFGVRSFSGSGGSGEQDPGPATLTGWLYYPYAMTRMLPPSTLHAALLGAALSLADRDLRRALWPVYTSLLTAFLLMNLSPNKEFRYSVALHPLLAVLAATGLLLLPRLLRPLLAATLLGSALLMLWGWLPMHRGWWAWPPQNVWADDKIVSSGRFLPSGEQIPTPLHPIDLIRRGHVTPVGPLPRQIPFDESTLPFGTDGP